MRIMLATLCLNEMEWLPKLVQQHIRFPNMVGWVFVESADIVYANTNANLVTKNGLSVDGTTEYLEKLSIEHESIHYVQHGFCKNDDPAQGKCEARNRYLEIADELCPDYIIVIDADEFWTHRMQNGFEEHLSRHRGAFGYTTEHRDIWHPPSIASEPLFKYEIVGGFWSILYCRVWKWFDGMRYTDNHNTPCRTDGYSLDKKMYDHRRDRMLGRKHLEYVHLGFAGIPKYRVAKNEYYRQRGEKDDPKRRQYTESRAYFESWKPGEKLPRGVNVIPYTGEIPEAFLEG